MESLRNKIVLITGASSGIGARTAVHFAKHGARLVLAGRNTDNLEKVADECILAGQARESVLTVAGDLKKEADVLKLMEETINHFKSLDILVNNAGINICMNIEQMTMAQYDELMTVNVRSMFLLTKLAIPHLKANKGNIVNVSSICSLRASIAAGVYSMSKAAVDMFTTVLALELGVAGVRVNSVNPGYIRTDIFRGLQLKEDETDKIYDAATTFHPLGRCGTVDEVASAILYLASDGASFITGTHLSVDGGLSKTASWYLQEIEQLQT